MKYSLMSLMLDGHLKMTKPNFIQLGIAWGMGFQGGPDSPLEEVLAFLNAHGVPMRNGDMSFEDLVRFARDSGYDGVDMMSFHFEEEGHKAREILETYGITLSAVDIIVPFVNTTSPEKFRTFFNKAKETIDQAYDAGCRNVLLMPSVYQAEEGITREQAFRNITAGLRACVAYGQGLGMTINTETLESMGVPLCSCGEMDRLFSAIPGLKYTHDTGNPLLAQESPTDTYERFRDRVAAVHFKDLAYAEEKGDYLASSGRYMVRSDFGAGLVDFRKHLELLKQDGYQGFITLEGSVPAKDPLEGAVKSLEYFKSMEASIP